MLFNGTPSPAASREGPAGEALTGDNVLNLNVDVNARCWPYLPNGLGGLAFSNRQRLGAAPGPEPQRGRHIVNGQNADIISSTTTQHRRHTAQRRRRDFEVLAGTNIQWLLPASTTSPTACR